MQRPPFYPILLVIWLLITSSLFLACGQKGDLYLPDETEQTSDKKKR